MSHFKFQILPKDELMQMQESGIYRVRDVATIKDIPNRLNDAKIGYNSDGPDYILENFDTYFAILVHGKKLEKHIIDKAFEQILRSFKQFIQNLKVILSEDDEINEEQLIKLCNVLQMTMYIVSGFITVYDSIYNKTDDSNCFEKKKRVKKTRDDNWSEEKHETLVLLYNCIRLQINRLWDPPIPESEFTNLIANTCFKVLEDPMIKNLKPLTETVFQILGTLVKEYNHGLDYPSRLIKLIQNHDHTISPVSLGVLMLVRDYGCRSLINRLIREIVDWQVNDSASLTAAELKQCSTFLVELAALLPDKIIPEIMFLGDQLDNDSYQFRITILSILAEVITVLSGEGLSDEAKDQRDHLLELLEDHFYDVNSFVRSKVLQLWGKLQQELAIPLSRQLIILEKVIERLRDKTSNVRKQAIATVKIFLEHNPCASSLNIEELKQKLIDENEKLNEIKAKIKDCDPSLEKKQHWVEIHKELRDFIQKKLEDEAAEPDESIKETQTRFDLKESIEQIEGFLFQRKYDEAYEIVRVAAQRTSEVNHRRKEMEIDAQIDFLLLIFHNLFVENGVLNAPSITAEQLHALKEQQEKQESIVAFFNATLDFTKLFSEAVSIIKTLIRSKVIGECAEAIDFFTTARNFSLKDNIHGVLEMLSLVYLKEQDRKEAVVKAFGTMFLLTTAKSDRGHSLKVVKNLTLLIQNIQKEQYFALKQIIMDWVKKGEIRNEEIILLWERFTLKQPDTSENDCRAALLLLDIMSEAKPEIATVNLDVLITVLQTRGVEDFRITQTIASMLAKLGKTVHASRGNKSGFRYNRENDEIVQIFERILKEGWKINDCNYLSMCVKIIDFFYESCDHPDIICGYLLKHFYTIIYDSTNANDNTVPVYMFLRFVTFVGHVGLRQLVFLDDTIYKELRRRNFVRDQNDQKKKAKEVKNAKRRSKTVNTTLSSSVQPDDSGVSTASASISRKKQAAIDEEQMAVEGAVADDADAEFIFNVLENEILSDETLLGVLTNLLVQICQNPSKCSDQSVMTASVQAFTKMLTISQTFAEQRIQLAFTILNTSKNVSVRSNVILALADLTKRFPNLLEPWTPYMYKSLRDESVRVRETALMILSHLIDHDMVRVKGQISEVALCMVDNEPMIQKSAKVFFRQLAQKGNALYNVLPDIISKLCDASAEVSEKDFKIILKHLLDLIQKDKLMESLVGKLCVRFRVSTMSVRQWHDLAYCLSIMNYNDKALKLLIENVPTFKEQLHDQKVYNYFKHIVSVASKNTKAETKELATQLGEKIEDCLKLDGQPQTNGNPEENDDEEAPANTSKAPPKTVKKTKKKSAKKSNSSNEDSDAGQSQTGQSARNYTRAKRRSRTTATRNISKIFQDSSDESSSNDVPYDKESNQRKSSKNSNKKVDDADTEVMNNSDDDDTGVKSLRRSRHQGKKQKKI